jgi:hypothetical protein
MPGSVRGLARDGFKTVIVHCVGTHPIKRECCYRHEYRAGIERLKTDGLISMHDSGGFFTFTEKGAQQFA